MCYNTVPAKNLIKYPIRKKSTFKTRKLSNNKEIKGILGRGIKRQRKDIKSLLVFKTVPVNQILQKKKKKHSLYSYLKITLIPNTILNNINLYNCWYNSDQWVVLLCALSSQVIIFWTHLHVCTLLLLITSYFSINRKLAVFPPHPHF